MENRLDKIEAKLDKILKLLNTANKSAANKSPANKSKDAKAPVVVKSGYAVITKYNDAIIVTGNTYANKEAIKSIGGKWCKEQKGWQIKTENMDKLVEIVNVHFESSKIRDVNENIIKDTEEDCGQNDHLNNLTNAECFIDSDSD